MNRPPLYSFQCSTRSQFVPRIAVGTFGGVTTVWVQGAATSFRVPAGQLIDIKFEATPDVSLLTIERVDLDELNNYRPAEPTEVDDAGQPK